MHWSQWYSIGQKCLFFPFQTFFSVMINNLANLLSVYLKSLFPKCKANIFANYLKCCKSSTYALETCFYQRVCRQTDREPNSASMSTGQRACQKWTLASWPMSKRPSQERARTWWIPMSMSPLLATRYICIVNLYWWKSLESGKKDCNGGGWARNVLELYEDFLDTY